MANKHPETKQEWHGRVVSDFSIEREIRKDLNIFQRINEIKRLVKSVVKDVNNPDWTGVTHDKVTETVRESLIKFGIHIVTDVSESKVSETGINRFYHGNYLVTFINIDTPSETFSVRVEGMSSGETHTLSSIAMSQALKIALLKTFNLLTNENDENLEPFPPPGDNPFDIELITKDEALIMRECLRRRDTSEEHFLKTFEVDALEVMTKAQYQRALNIIKKMAIVD